MALEGKNSGRRRRSTPCHARFLCEEVAAAATEYALILAFIALITIAALTAIGVTVSGPYNVLAQELLNAVG